MEDITIHVKQKMIYLATFPDKFVSGEEQCAFKVCADESVPPGDHPTKKAMTFVYPK